jgi:alkylhydroperoxidase family enzyme
MASNDKAGVAFAQPKSFEERVGVAKQCSAALEITMPMVVDDLDDHVGHLYSGMPDRLYIIDRQGNVAYKGGRGPFGFKTGELEQSLILLLLDQGDAKKAASRLPCGLPILSNEEAWRLLPPAEEGAGQDLPVWARVLARTLPRTTAAMLELDYAHRANSPLDARLRAKVRHAAARANGCGAAAAMALADLRRAGASEAEMRRLVADPTDPSDPDAGALAFAHKLTRDAYTVTDEEFAGIKTKYGDKQTVALVLLLAYSNFQDRLLLSLHVPADDPAAQRALAVRFAKNAPPATVPPRTPSELSSRAPAPARVSDPGWLAFDFAELQKRLEAQKAREPRIAVPSWDEVRKALPPGGGPNRPLRIRWSLVCLGYQPELASAWSACTRAFGQEAKQDRVFEESLFWVVTRSLQCFY